MRRLSLFIIISAFINHLSQAQSFVAFPIPAVPVRSDGAIDVGDYDKDGDLDFAVTGVKAYITQNGGITGAVGYTGIYKNTGGQFSEVTGLNLLEVYTGDIAWGDFDNDNDLDLIVSGHPTGNNASNAKALALYQNNGNDSFTKITTTITPFDFGKFELADFDKDGLLDIGITGSVEGPFSNVGFADVYRNTGNFNFQRMNLNIAQVSIGAMAFIDIEKDGDLDIILNGFTGSAYQTYFYSNNNNNLTLAATLLDNVSGVIMGVHDLNNDGFDDVVLSGIYQQSPYNRVFYIYFNNNGTLARKVMPFVGLTEGSVDFADVDEDGDIDLLVTGDPEGSANSKYVTEIIRNDGSSFSVLPNQFEGSFRGGARWGDFDLDGDYDFIKFCYGNGILTSESPNGGGTILYLQCNSTSSIQTSISATICFGTSYSFGGTSISTAGEYSKTFNSKTGCDSLVTLTLQVQQNPDKPILIGSCAEISITNNSGVNTIDWLSSDTPIPNEHNEHLYISSPGTFKAVFINNNCRTVSDPLQVNAEDLIPPDKPKIDIGCLHLTTSNDKPNYNIYWIKNDLTLANNIKSIDIEEGGIYKAVFHNNCGESFSDPIAIYFPNDITESFDLNNVLTTNGDGKNEVYFLREYLKGSSITIVNRWGKSVYSNKNYQNDWNGSGLDSGVYYCIVRNTCYGDFKGTISIIR